MFIAKKALSRRTILRGMGAAIALPMLPGPVDWGSPDDPDDEPVYFLTVMPIVATDDVIDAWIVPLAESLGLDPEPAIAEGGYQRAMEQAKKKTQKKFPHDGTPERPRAAPSFSTFRKMTRMISPNPSVTMAR